MMRNSVHWAISIVLCLSIWSCNQQKKADQDTNTPTTEKVKTKKVSKAKPAVKKIKQPKVIRLTDANVEVELLKFGAKNTEQFVLLKTPKGNMTLKLYKNTPLHRANFIRLVKNDFYRETMFYRVVDDFMIQGGDNDDWERSSIKNKMGDYTLPAEFRESNIHQKGAVSMAREYEDNPELRSVSFEFFIVQGTKYSEGELLGAELQYDLKISPEHKEIYRTIGGTPHLDGQHTVFAQVIDGLEVIDSIAKVNVDEGDWPIDDITIDFKIIN